MSASNSLLLFYHIVFSSFSATANWVYKSRHINRRFSNKIEDKDKEKAIKITTQKYRKQDKGKEYDQNMLHKILKEKNKNQERKKYKKQKGNKTTPTS